MAALRMASLILDAFFDGDPAKWRNQGQDHPMFRALLHDDRLEPSTTTIWYAIGVYEQCEQLPAEVAHSLTLAHHRALLPIEDLELKEALARRAVRQGWSKRRLAAEVRRATPQSPARGRPRTPALVKVARMVHGGLQRCVTEPLDREAAARFGHQATLEALQELRRDLVALSTLVEDAERLLGDGRRAS